MLTFCREGLGRQNSWTTSYARRWWNWASHAISFQMMLGLDFDSQMVVPEGLCLCVFGFSQNPYTYRGCFVWHWLVKIENASRGVFFSFYAMVNSFSEDPQFCMQEFPDSALGFFKSKDFRCWVTPIHANTNISSKTNKSLDNYIKQPTHVTYATTCQFLKNLSKFLFFLCLYWNIGGIISWFCFYG